jgi:UDP-N-acetylmuramate dehydrogenase
MKAHPEIPLFPGPNSFYTIPAAWLIESCGWKGKQIGKVGVSPSHALVLVNYGGAQGREIVLLADSIVKDVEAKIRFQLIPEVNIIR